MNLLRSLLFVPAGNRRLLDGAHRRGADALILDLEDAVPAVDKAAARIALPGEIERLTALDMTLVVRLNAFDHADDISAAVRPGVTAVMVPKLESLAQLQVLAGLLDVAEAAEGLRPGAVAVIALIETPAALFQLAAIAAHPRVSALGLGSEDLALALGVPPTPACLTLPCQWLALAAAAHGKQAYGLPVSLADFQQLTALDEGAAQARAMGLHGTLCIHPAQVPVVNRAFAPSAAELAWARAVAAAWDVAEAKGEGAAQLNGAMLDKPVVERARRLLAQDPLRGATR